MLRFLFSANGRVSRGAYWLRWILPSTIVTLTASALDASLDPDIAGNAGVFSGLASLAMFWPNTVITVKRYHDRGMSGWWVLWSLLIVGAPLMLVFAATETLLQGNLVGAWIGAFVGLYGAVFAVTAFALIVYFLPGERGANRFGPDPLPARARKTGRDPAVEFPGPWTRPTGTSPRGRGPLSRGNPAHRRQRPPRST